MSTIQEALENYKNRKELELEEKRKFPLRKKLDKAYETSDIVKLMFYACCLAPDEAYLRLIEHEGVSDNLVLFSSDIKFITSYQDIIPREIGIHNLISDKRWKLRDLCYLDIREAFIRSKSLNLIHTISRPGSEFDDWNIYIRTTQADVLVFDIILSQNPPDPIDTPDIQKSNTDSILTCLSFLLNLFKNKPKGD